MTYWENNNPSNRNSFTRNALEESGVSGFGKVQCCKAMPGPSFAARRFPELRTQWQTLGDKMIGEKFGKLVVVSFHHKDGNHRKWWLCDCVCGKKTVLHTGNLRSGNTKSCGCLIRESARLRRISDSHSDVTAVILGYKRHAKARGHEWLLSREDVITLISMPCRYCGSSPHNKKLTKNSMFPLVYGGMDRVDNNMGYVSSNVVPCCHTCNNAKSNLTKAQFYAWVKRIASMAEQWG